MSSAAGPAIEKLFMPDKDGRTYVGQGPKTDEFERTFADRTGLSQAPLGVNSCTSAIDLALHLIGVGPGDTVIMPPMTCSATGGPVVNRGAKILWADVDPILGTILPLSVASLVDEHTKAIIAVDWGGRACDYAALRDVTGGAIPIIEDAAHRLYAPADHGDYVCWSFGPIKTLTCGGYGGALLPPQAEYNRARLLRWHGLDRLSNNDFRCQQNILEPGFRYHMTDDLAVVGLTNLPLAQHGVKRARINAFWYERLRDIPGITIPPFDPSSDYWIYNILIHDDRDDFMQRMARQGVTTSRVHARIDIHSGFRAATLNPGPLPGVDFYDAHQTAIPVGHWLSAEDRDHVVDAVRESVSSSATLEVAGTGSGL